MVSGCREWVPPVVLHLVVRFVYLATYVARRPLVLGFDFLSIVLVSFILLSHGYVQRQLSVLYAHTSVQPLHVSETAMVILFAYPLPRGC